MQVNGKLNASWTQVSYQSALTCIALVSPFGHILTVTEGTIFCCLNATKRAIKVRTTPAFQTERIRKVL